MNNIMMLLTANQITLWVATFIGVISPIKYVYDLLNLPKRDTRIPSGLRNRWTGKFVSRKAGIISFIGAIMGGATFVAGKFFGIALWSSLLSFFFSVVAGGWVDIVIALVGLGLTFTNSN